MGSRRAMAASARLSHSTGRSTTAVRSRPTSTWAATTVQETSARTMFTQNRGNAGGNGSSRRKGWRVSVSAMAFSRHDG